MKYLLLFIIFVCLGYILLRTLVIAGHLFLWSLQLGLPVIAVLVCGLLYLRYRNEHS